MKANDFVSGDRIVSVTPNDNVDNVVFPNKPWVTAFAYQKDQTVTLATTGETWQALRANTSVSPVEGADWTKVNGVIAQPSVIFCNGVTGDVAFISAGGDQKILAIAANDLLAKGAIRVRRVLVAGTTATLLFAIAE